MPEAPPGTQWRFDIRSQLWFAQDRASGKAVSYLQDGVKYLLGIGHLPTGRQQQLAALLLIARHHCHTCTLLSQRSWPNF
jgi:hypothetical protein